MGIVVIDSLQKEINGADPRTQKLFYKQKTFMEQKPDYPSLGRKKLRNVFDKYGNPLWEVRLDIHRRIVFIEREGTATWLKIVNHDQVNRGSILHVDGH